MHSESFFEAPVITNFPVAESVGLAKPRMSKVTDVRPEGAVAATVRAAGSR